MCFRGGVGDEVSETVYTREQRLRYREKVRLCLDVFERMLGSSTFDAEKPLTGLEVELNLVNADYQPHLGNMAVLEEIADPAFQTELGAYNIELNVPPRSLVAGVPAKVLRALTEQEMAWKVEGTRSYQDLTRRSLATMRATAPLAAPEADRKRLELPELLPLSTLKAQAGD